MPVEMRCPEKTYRLFGKISEGRPRIVPDNLIEFSCRECRSLYEGAALVLHRFNLLGELVETEVLPGTAVRRK